MNRSVPRTASAWALGAACILAAGTLAAAPALPPGPNYQSVVKDSLGKPLDGSFDMLFRFMDAATDGAEILTDSHTEASGQSVTVRQGLLEVQLGGGRLTDGSGPGDYTSIADMFRDYPTVYLEIEVGGAALRPRVCIEAASRTATASVPEQDEGEERGDHPTDALRFRNLQLQDENGDIPVDGLKKALAHVESMQHAEAVSVAGLTPASWSWLGPGNKGGRIRSILIDPGNPNKMWVGSVSGGIWRTIDAGVSWQSANALMPSLAISSLVMDPTNSNTLYAGTGESFKDGLATPGERFDDGVQGAGVYKSVDGGATWNQLSKTNPADTTDPTICGGIVPCPWLYVNRLAISPDGSTILAATAGGIERSTDGGVTWNRIPGFAGDIEDIDFDPANSQKAIAARAGQTAHSTDGGVNWVFASYDFPFTGRAELAYAPSDPNIVYLSVAVPSTNPPTVPDGVLYRSSNGGHSFTQVNTGNNLLGGQGFYDNIVWVNPDDPSFVIVAGVAAYRSTDSGATFTAIGNANANLPHADHHMIVAHPGFNNTTNRTVFFGNDGGIQQIDDVAVAAPATSGWHSLNNGLGITQFYGASSNSAGVIVGGTQDNGNVRFTGDPQNWSDIPGAGGDGGYTAADPTDPNYFYAEYVYLQVRRSTDAGATATNIFAGLGDANNSSVNFVAPITLDPSDPNTLLGGGLSLWRSNDVKAAVPTWSAIKPPSNSSPISAIAVSSATSSFIAVGHNNGEIWFTFTGTSLTPLWIQVNNGTPNRLVTRFAIDTSKTPNWVYATYGGFKSDDILVTKDLGNSWTVVTGNGQTALPAAPVRTLVLNPVHPDFLYVGTEVGVFASEDAGATWQLPQGGPARVAVDELFWRQGHLTAVTYGRGLYTTIAPMYLEPICAFSASCQCGGFWDCACAWPAGVLPGSNDDVLVSCPVTVRTGATAKNLKVNAPLTLNNSSVSSVNVGVVQTLTNNSVISTTPGTQSGISAQTLQNVASTVVANTGIIALSGAINVSGELVDGGAIGVTTVDCTNLTVAASDGSLGPNATLSTSGAVTVHGNIFNNGTINANSITLTAPASGAPHALSGSGHWQADTFAVGQLSGTDVASLASDLTLDAHTQTFVASGARLNQSGHVLTINGAGVDSRGVFDVGASVLNLNGMASASFAKATGTGTINLNATSSTALGPGIGAGTFQPALHLLSGNVTTPGGTLDGPITIDPGATLGISGNGTIVLNADLTVNGAFTKTGTNSVSTSLTFNGLHLVNNGSLLADFVVFNASGSSRAQSLAGAGAWPAAKSFTIGSGGGSVSTTTLMNNVTMPHNQFNVSSGSTLNLQSNVLTYTGSSMSNGGTVSGTGSFVMSPGTGAANLQGGGLGSDYSAVLRMASGTVAISSGTVYLSGLLLVDSGATLTQAGFGGVWITGDVTINGTLRDFGTTFYFVGSRAFTNNGTVQTVYLNFGTGSGSPLTQTVGGTGAWTGPTARLFVGLESTTTLLTDVSYGGPAVWIDGTVQTGTHTFSLPCGTTWAGQGDVFGNVRRTNLAACPGVAIAYGNPFTTIQFTSGTPPTDLTVNLAAAPPSGLVNPALRSYVITPTGGSGYQATLRLHYRDSELNGNAESSLQLYRYDGTGWTPEGATARDTTNNWVEYAGVTQFSPWGMAGPQPVLAGEVPATLTVEAASGSPGNLLLRWAASCTGGAQDYAIYEGTIGSWYSHTMLDCTDNGGDRMEIVAPSPGNRYYLVVPRNATGEGSYGQRSNHAERPVGTSTCVATQIVGGCP